MKFKVEPEELIRQRLFKPNQAGVDFQLKNLIYQAAVTVVGKRTVKPEDIVLEHPTNPDHGDYATNIALKVQSRAAGKAFSPSRSLAMAERGGDARQKLKVKSQEEISTSFTLANQIVNILRSQGLPDFIAKIEVAKPGFINFWLSQEWLVSQRQRVLKEADQYGSGQTLRGRQILLEHTSPNPQTTIMLGHLRNNFLGMSVANILEFLGAKVTKDCIVNDRGIHLCRSIFGYLVFGRKRGGFKKAELLGFKKISDSQIKKASTKTNWQELLGEWSKKKSHWWTFKDLGLKPDHANLIWYVLGSRAYKLSEEVKKQVEEILLAWEAEDKKTWQVWRQILGWSDKGYQETYGRVGSVHDWVWYEHQLYKEGKKLVEKGVKKGIFRQSEGAIVSDLKKYHLPDTVLIKSDGASVYHTFDLNLVAQKRKKFSSDLYIWDIGVEQSLYFKQLFAMCEQLGIAKREKLFHLSYALINFKGGKKMSTRRGKVVTGDEVLDELHRRALEIIKTSNQELRGGLTTRQLDRLAETVALGAIKYSLLKFGRETTIQFDIDESLALEGNSGPYLQYTYSRCRSVLQRAGNSKFQIPNSKLKRKTERPKITQLLNYSITSLQLQVEEVSLLRTLYRFPEVIQEAAESFAPNLLCNFLFDLAQKYNLFYHRQPILKAAHPELVERRLALTAATAQVLQNGLHLLGISTPERM